MSCCLSSSISSFVLILNPQSFASQGIVVITLSNSQCAVDEQITHPGGILVGLIERRLVAIGAWVEDNHVGEISRLEVTALGQPQDVRGQAGGTTDRLL